MKKEPLIDIDGKKAAYISQGNNAKAVLFYVENPDIPAAVRILMSPGVSKDKVVEIYKSFDFFELKKIAAKAINWPAVIPAEAQIKATIVKIDNSASSIGGYVKEIKVVAVMNDKLISELKRIQKQYNTPSLTVIKVSRKIDFVCASAESIGNLKRDFRENDEIEFIYYAK